MRVGTKVRALRDGSVHPDIRGVTGEVVAPGPCGTVEVRFEHADGTKFVHPSALEVVPEVTDVGTE